MLAIQLTRQICTYAAFKMDEHFSFFNTSAASDSFDFDIYREARGMWQL